MYYPGEDKKIVAKRGDKVLGAKGEIVCTFARDIHGGWPVEHSDFSWPGKIPHPREGTHPAIVLHVSAIKA